MNARDEWNLTQSMMAGDFNPYHDPINGRFASGHKFFSQIDKATREVKPEYYPKMAEELGVSVEEAKAMADAVNYYTRHSVQFREYTKDPEKYAAKYGKDAAAKERDRLALIESFLEKSPKWKGGRLYRGFESDDARIARLKAGEVVNLGGPSSWSSDKSVSEIFAGNVRGISIGQQKSVILVTNKKETLFGASVRHLSGAPTDEREVLVTGDARFIPSGKVVDLGSVVYVYGDIGA